MLEFFKQEKLRREDLKLRELEQEKFEKQQLEGLKNSNKASQILPPGVERQEERFVKLCYKRAV